MFREAAQHFSDALEKLPEDHFNRYRLAPLLAWTESFGEHEQLCREMLDHWENTDDAILAERTAKVCLLLPPPDDILRRAARLAHHTETIGADSELLPFFTTVAAMADYREGNYDVAIERLEATDMLPWGGALYAIPQYVLAMSQQQSGNAEMARRVFDRASAAIDQQLLQIGEGEAAPDDLGAGWSDLLAAWTFRREAESLIDTPEAAPMYLGEGHALAMRGEFHQAARYFSRAVRHLPDNHYNRQRLAVLVAWLDNRAAYDEVRLDLLLRWGDTDDVIVAERTAKACLLLSATDDALQQVVYLARKAETQGADHTFLPLFSLAAAIAEFRAGNYERAIEKLEQYDYEPWGSQFLTVAQLVLALSHQRSGNVEAAKDLLQQASKIIDEQMPRVSEDEAVATDLGPNWSDFLICWILRREAEIVVGTSTQGAGYF